ncbi:MAG TPA: 1,4-alpha-glucan branching protein GlgB [Magnetospirillaceae bacterium]|jgi:1,4-alpha-glucan branching enzyme
MARASWRATDETIRAIIAARHPNPFSVLGLQQVGKDFVIRAFLPYAETIEAKSRDGKFSVALKKIDPAGFFEGHVDGAVQRFAYRLTAANAGGSWEFADPYSFGPVLGQTDDYLLVEGTHRSLYEKLGAHPMVHGNVSGTHFAVWAPHAKRVSVVGDFNRWDGRTHQMRKRVDSGIWEIFAPEVGEGIAYKYEIIGPNDDLQPLKADPFGFGAEMRPSTASIVTRTDNFAWTDAAYIEERARKDPRRTPMSIYEVHLGSWRRHWDNAFLSYDELAEQLISYAVDMGYTHLELLPVSEHPLDDSWGYQPIGLFAPTRRFGEPAAFARFVDKAHAAGLGVILDWVPAHFPVDQHGLARFDGAPLYEYADPRRGFQPDWNTAIYDFGRPEVMNFLFANALFWLDRYHIDGLRIDAVASMLYLDYSRKPGEWIPNIDGGNDNREAVAFLRRVSELAYGLHPGTVTIAEESTSWAGVTQPVYANGLGFGFKWNMGWMHDTLEYMAKEPVHRRYHHKQMTFGMMYAYSENFVLPLSHDEVVHGKRSIAGRMPGDEWQRFANLRAYFAFMWAYSGKKLLFMGQDFGQIREWNFNRELEWNLLDYQVHRGTQSLVRDLNRAYRTLPALHARDCEPEGFRWTIADDADQSIFAWVRYGGPGDAPVAVICNFTPVPRRNYRIGLPQSGPWQEIINTDAKDYGGSGVGNGGGLVAEDRPAHGFPASAMMTLPPLGTIYLKYGNN